MPRKKYTAEQIIAILRDAEILIAEGHSIATTSRKLGITEQTYYRWRKGIRRDEGRACKAAQGSGEGERPVEKAPGRG